MIPQGFAQPNLQTICGIENLQVYILFMHTCSAPQKYVAIVFNPIPTGLGHVTLIYGLIPPMAGRNRVKSIRMTELFSCGAEYS